MACKQPPHPTRAAAWSRNGHGEREKRREFRWWGLGEPLMGDVFILKAQPRKGVPNPQGLSKMGFSKRKD